MRMPRTIAEQMLLERHLNHKNVYSSVQQRLHEPFASYKPGYDSLVYVSRLEIRLKAQIPDIVRSFGDNLIGLDAFSKWHQLISPILTESFAFYDAHTTKSRIYAGVKSTATVGFIGALMGGTGPFSALYASAWGINAALRCAPVQAYKIAGSLLAYHKFFLITASNILGWDVQLSVVDGTSMRMENGIQVIPVLPAHFGRGPIPFDIFWGQYADTWSEAFYESARFEPRDGRYAHHTQDPTAAATALWKLNEFIRTIDAAIQKCRQP